MSDYAKLRQIVLTWCDEMEMAPLDTVLRRAAAQSLRARVDEVIPKSEQPRNEADAFIAWFNRELRRSFTVNPGVVKMVKALLSVGYTQKDMRMVALYLKSRWEGDAKMQDYLVPSTILVAQKFGERLDLAKEAWEGNR